jgi:DNA transposition AAA+ family ATPase
MSKKEDTGYNEELYTRFFELVGTPDEGKKISQSKAAQALGYSSGVISAYKSRSYNGNVRTLEEKIEAWLKREARRLEKVEIPTAETTVLDQVRRAVSIAQDDADIAVIVGDAGTGKTTALRRYEAESHSAFLVEVDPSFTKNVLVTEIARTVGVDPKGGMTLVISRIIDTLRERDAVLIIDEADYLSDSSLELVRRIINDKAKTGVVLAGLPRLEYKLRNLRNDHEQLASRVGVLLKVGRMNKADAVKILSGVWKNLDKEAVNAFTAMAGGSVRTLVKLMGRVHQIMGINRLETPDVDVVSTAGELLMR